PRHERGRREVVDLARRVRAQHVGERRLVEDVDVAAADPDDVVAAAAEELCEKRPVLPRRADDQRAQCSPRTYAQAALNPSGRSAYTINAHTTSPRSAAGTGGSTSDSAPNASAVAPPIASARRDSPAAAIASVSHDSIAIRPAAMTNVDTPSASARPFRPQSSRNPSPTGIATTNPTTASGTSVLRLSATNTSGNVTANPTHASIQSAR